MERYLVLSKDVFSNLKNRSFFLCEKIIPTFPKILICKHPLVWFNLTLNLLISLIPKCKQLLLAQKVYYNLILEQWQPNKKMLLKIIHSCCNMRSILTINWMNLIQAIGARLMQIFLHLIFYKWWPTFTRLKCELIL